MLTAVANKWVQYFDVYYRYFAKYAGKEVHFLEVGVQSGGSIELWKAFFGPGLHYYGVDINPYTKPLFESQGPPRIKVFVGSQSDRAFWQSQVLPNVPKLDIVLDDGGHTMEQQIVTFEEIYKHVKPEGIYVVEDCATSYNGGYGGGYRKPNTWIEYSKSLIDTALHADYFNNGINRTSVTESTMSIAYYDQMVVFEKGSHTPAGTVQAGNAEMETAPPTKDGAVDPEVLKTLQELFKKAP
jgi:SAM-dependent methyltransferase